MNIIIYIVINIFVNRKFAGLSPDTIAFPSPQLQVLQPRT